MCIYHRLSLIYLSHKYACLLFEKYFFIKKMLSNFFSIYCIYLYYVYCIAPLISYRIILLQS